MDNSSTDNQMQLEALAHQVCRSHSARPERDLYRICPSKLSKRELEDLYFALLENNLELKRTINSQNEKLKMLSTKVQRLSASKTPGNKDKDCCLGKTLINEQKDSITELKKCNERMAERIRVLNMRLCSAKQFLKKQPVEQKNTSKSPIKNTTNFQHFKKVCENSKPHQAALEYKISKSVETSTDNPLVTQSPKKGLAHQCDENKCRTAIEELQQKIKELQEELHNTQFNYATKLHDLENEIRSVMDENVRARADSLAQEERGDELVDRLRAAEGRGDDLETQLAIEKSKVKELETRLKLADNDKNIAKSLDQLSVITEQRDPDESSQPSYKFHSRQSISAPKNETDIESAVSYYIPERQESQVSVKSEPKRVEPEVESLAAVPSQKSYRRDSQASVKIKEPKPRESKIESELQEGLPIPSSKGQRKESIAEMQEPKSQVSKTESEFLKEEPSIPPSKGQRKGSIVELKEPKPLASKTESVFLKPELKEELPIPPSKGQRKGSIAETKDRKPQEAKIESEYPKIEIEERQPSSPSLKTQRKKSMAEFAREPKPQEYNKIEPEINKNELEEGFPIPSSQGKRKESIVVTEDTKPQESKTTPQVSPILSHKPHRRESLASAKLEVLTPTKSNHEVKFSKSNDSGYTDPNKSYDVEPEKDEEMLKINRELLKKIADLKSQLDLLMIAAAGAKPAPAPAQLPETMPSVVDTKMMESDSVPTKSLSTHSTVVPNKIEPKQQVEAKTEDDMKRTPSSAKSAVVQNAGQIPKQLPNEDNLPKHVPYEDKEQKPFSYKDHADNFLASPSLEKTKSLADEKTPIVYDDQMEKPIPYEIEVPRSALYPELIQKVPQNKQEVKSQPKEERDAITSSYKDKVPTTNQRILQEPPLNEGTELSSYDIIAQRPRLSEENVPIPPSEVITKQPSTFEEKMPSPYEDVSKNRPYQERLSTSSYVNKTQNPPKFPLEYEVKPRESRLPSYHPYQGRKSSLGEDIPEAASYEGTIHKSQLYEKPIVPEENREHKEYVDIKRGSLFYKDGVPNVDKKQESILYDDKIQAPNRNNDSLFYEEIRKPNLPYEDKIYPDEQKSTVVKTRTPSENLGNFDEKRNSSLYAERIEKFSLDDNGPTTSSPYEEKMQKLHDEKRQMASPPEDEKSIRFESYIHMAESGSRDYGPEFGKFQDKAEDDQNNEPNENRRTSSSVGTNKADDHNGFQIPGPIPSTLKPTPIDRKKPRISFDKTKNRPSEEKSVKIIEEDKEPSGYSIYLDKNSISKVDSSAITDYDDDDKRIRKESKPRASIDFSQVTDNPKEFKDMYQRPSNKPPHVESYTDMIGNGVDVPPSAMQEQATQIDQQFVWCVAGARVCTCPPGPLVTGPLRTCSGTKRPAPPHMRYCACCNDKNLQGPGCPPRRDSATYTQSGIQPQTYTVPKDAYTQPRRETLDQKTYTQNGKDEYKRSSSYAQNVQTPRYSRSTSPDNTDREISSLPDLPPERETKATHGYLSPGEKATMTFTDNGTSTDNCSLSEGELPGTKKATKSFGEKGVETSRPADSSTQRMEDVLKAISEELSRCHRLLANQKREERSTNEVNKQSENDGVQLRASQGARRLTGAHHVCVFTLHIGTLVLSDEAVLQSRDKNLVLTWRFYDQSVTMTRMHAGRVVVFDFSTEYDVVFSEDFMNYMKYEKMPLLVCEINKQDKPFATCSLPLRDALLHVNRRADMSLALSGGPGCDPESAIEELGVLDLWCVLRCDAVITQHLTKSMSRPSNLGARNSYHQSLVEEDYSNERLSEDLDLKMKKESREQDAFSKNMPINHKKSYSGYLPPDEISRQVEFGGSVADDVSNNTFKMNKRRSSLGHSRMTNDRKDVSFDGSSHWASKFAIHPNATGLIANAVPSNIRSTEEMKAALERNAIHEEKRKMPNSEDKSLLSRKNLSKQKFSKKLSEDFIGSLQDLISNNKATASDRKNSLPKYELAPTDKSENELAKKYNDISKLMVSRMDAAKKSVKYSDDEEQPQKGVEEEDPPPQSIEITVLWLALNEECDAMVNPNIKRLYVAYKFLGRNGAELETPVSLPKPKHYVDKCFFNFKKTFHLHDADLPALGHMARVRGGSRVSTDPRDCLVFTVVSEPPEDPLGLSSCEDVGYAYLYLGDILAYASGSGAYTEVVAVHTARGSNVCGVLAVKIDGLHVLRRALTLSHSAKDLERPVMAY